MDLYRTSESGLVAVQPLDPGETAGLAGALLRGPGGALGAEDVLFVTTSAGDGTATALALDRSGSVVVVGAADGEVGSDTVTEALQRASAVAAQSYDALDDRYGDRSLQEAHADYFDRDPLAPAAFNDDQCVRLVGAAVADDALELATFLSDRELSVDPVRVHAFGAPASEEFLVRFEAIGEGEDERPEPAVAADGAASTEGDEQWVAGGGSTSPVETATSEESEGDDTADEDTGDEPTLADEEDDKVAADDPVEMDSEEDDEVGVPALLDSVAEGVRDRLVGNFDADPEKLVSVERGNELLVRPDNPAYAGGVLRYRLRVQPEGAVNFEVSIYGGSEAEKEQMRAVIRENEEEIEEMGYEVASGYDGFRASREFGSFDQVAAAEIVDEFDRLVRFFDPLVMRA